MYTYVFYEDRSMYISGKDLISGFPVIGRKTSLDSCVLVEPQNAWKLNSHERGLLVFHSTHKYIPIVEEYSPENSTTKNVVEYFPALTRCGNASFVSL